MDNDSQSQVQVFEHSHDFGLCLESDKSRDIYDQSNFNPGKILVI
jgi:hypothetical protein